MWNLCLLSVNIVGMAGVEIKFKMRDLGDNIEFNKFVKC